MQNLKTTPLDVLFLYLIYFDEAIRPEFRLGCIYLPFCIGGTEGLFTKNTLEITDDVLSSYKNQG
jgi:hypothetical protein